jgi:flagellar hook-associated protein 1 FlgK
MSLGLFGTLGMAARSLQTQQLGLEVTGQNLANVNNPAYARQRLTITASSPIPTSLGPQGTGAEGVAIQQIRSSLLDSQIQTETNIGSYWDTMQQILQSAQANLGEQIDTQAAGTNGTTSTSSQQGISQSLSDLFNAFQSLSTDPSSTAERQVLLQKAQTLVSQFNQVSQQLTTLSGDLDKSLQDDVTSANQLLSGIANLNDQINRTELSTGSKANDLRDLRQQKIEELSKLTKVDIAEQANGSVDVSIGGTLLVHGGNVLDSLETYDAGSGQLLVRTQTGGVDLALTGGSMQGTIDARDGELATLSNSLDAVASQIITSVNAIHYDGYGLTGTTHADFFTGSDAKTIGINTALTDDPRLIQASGTDGAVGDNQVALALAQLADQPIAALSNQTISQAYNQAVSTLGQSLASANTQVADQQVVQNMLHQQRDSISGVSMDEEMTNLTTFQRAYQASAKLITVIDELLTTLINMKT